MKLSKRTPRTFYCLSLVFFFCFFFSGCLKAGDADFQQGMKAYSKQDYDEALLCFEQAQQKECNYSKQIIYSMQANIYLAKGENASAILCLQKAIEEKSDYRILNMLSSLYHREGQDEKAIDALLLAIEQNPGQPEAYASLGALYLSQGERNIDFAQENLEKAKKMNPRLAIVHANLAICHALKGEKQKTATELQEAQRLKCENFLLFQKRVEEIEKNSNTTQLE